MNAGDRQTMRAAVYLILIKNDEVLLLRRANSGWRDGEYTLLAGHVDGGETIREALCREAKEEAGISIKPPDLQFAHVMHQTDDSEYVDFYFKCEVWGGEPQNLEPDKCDDMKWCAIDKLPENTVPNVKLAMREYKRGSYYSEFGW